MSTCFICGNELTDSNRSDEHIILASIGGKLKSRDLLCKFCNSKFGDKIDSELSKQLNSLANLLNIKRESGRGQPQPIRAKDDNTGKQYLLSSDGKPIIASPEVRQEGNQIHIVARSITDARKILKGLSKKYPQINVEEILEKVEAKSEYINSKLAFSVNYGGSDAFRSICKSAIEYYLYNAGDYNNIKHLIPYIKCEADMDVVWFYYRNPPIVQNHTDKIVHAIELVGDPADQLLYAYFEFFSSVKYIVMLSNNYHDEPIYTSYVYEVLTSEKTNITEKIHISKKEFENILNNKTLPSNDLQFCLGRCIRIAQHRQNDAHIKKMVSSAIDKSFATYPEGAIINEEMIKKFNNELMKEIGPWIAHMIPKNKL